MIKERIPISGDLKSKVKQLMATQWQEVLYWVIIASITLANLFALRQDGRWHHMALQSHGRRGRIQRSALHD